MRCVLFQFSGTGNTWYVAQALKQSFEALGITCSVISLETAHDADHLIEGADVIGLGYPIYGSDFPEPVARWLESLLYSPSKRAFVYCTQFRYSGDGAAIGAKALREKGYLVRQLMHVNMPNNITDYRFVRWLKPPSPERLMCYVKGKADRMAEAVKGDKRLYKGETLMSLVLGLVQRIPFRLGRQAAKTKLKVDVHCVGCGLCVALCPSHNLSIEAHVAKPSNRCYLCYRCINHCPVQALHFAKNTRVLRPYHGPVPGFEIDRVRKHMP